jgi:2-polyprenyl-3-methyl-5-hydroxy-6-metoxy-1,4-benzoquinol methylase
MPGVDPSRLVIGTYWANVNWTELTEWWLAEVSEDPAYAGVVTPLLLKILGPEHDLTYLDVGCGEGRVMRAVAESGATVHGLDINVALARRARLAMVGHALEIPARDAGYDGVYSVLTLEHIPEHDRFFAEMARVTKPGGVLAVVINHPTWTAPGSTPISDSDGEILWRTGEYFSDGSSDIQAGEGTITFHHRSMSALLNAAANAGWNLEQMVEQPHHDFEDQAGIPRLLACRWRRAAG